MTEDFKEIVSRAKKAFESGKTRSVEWRKQQLRALVSFLEENEDLIYESLNKDMKRGKQEAFMMDINTSRTEIILALEHIDEWIRPEPVKTDIIGKISKVYIRKEPYGVCLILGAWNFPLLLVLSPLVGAIAAGNCAIIKPSELTYHTTLLIQQLLPKYIDKDCFPVVICGPEGSAKLLDENRFDLIFYTGGSHVGKLVMSAASKNLTPVVLELGGKNPAILDRNCDVKLAARRVTWSKFISCGQICLATDYVLCHEDIYEEFLKHVKSAVLEFYGEDPKKSKSFSRIVNERHVKRLSKLLSGGKIIVGGEVDEEEKYIAPTVMVDVTESSPVMQEEVFGPILPVLKYKTVDEAIAFVQRREKPLALYIFSKDKKFREKILENTSSGGVTINDCLMHHNEFQPFGGVGHSGMGCYHGRYSFETFSHKRSCFENRLPDGLLSVRYAPFSEKKRAILKKHLMKKLPREAGLVTFMLQLLKLSLMGILIAFVYQWFCGWFA